MFYLMRNLQHGIGPRDSDSTSWLIVGSNSKDKCNSGPHHSTSILFRISSPAVPVDSNKMLVEAGTCATSIAPYQSGARKYS